jgi:hypothetical protein
LLTVTFCPNICHPYQVIINVIFNQTKKTGKQIIAKIRWPYYTFTPIYHGKVITHDSIQRAYICIKKKKYKHSTFFRNLWEDQFSRSNHQRCQLQPLSRSNEPFSLLEESDNLRLSNLTNQYNKFTNHISTKSNKKHNQLLTNTINSW